MKAKHLFPFFALAIAVGCNQNAGSKESSDAKKEEPTKEEASASAAKASLEMEWDSEVYYPTNESVLYEPNQNILYVSCIAGKPTEIDGKGHIARMAVDGSIIDSVWARGLNAPKGMCIFDGRLYVSDVNRIVSINLDNPEDKVAYEVPGSVFLNDLTAGLRGVFFSDMQTGMLHYLESGIVHTINENLPNLNGLAYFENQLYALNADGLLRLSPGGEVLETVNSTVTGGDGLIPLGDNRFIASRWQGEIWFIEGPEAHKMFDATADEIQTADIGYNPNTQTVYAPRFFANKVTAFKLK